MEYSIEDLIRAIESREYREMLVAQKDYHQVKTATLRLGLTLEECRLLTHMSLKTLREEIENGNLRAVRDARQVIVWREELDRWVHEWFDRHTDAT